MIPYKVIVYSINDNFDTTTLQSYFDKITQCTTPEDIETTKKELDTFLITNNYISLQCNIFIGTVKDKEDITASEVKTILDIIKSKSADDLDDDSIQTLATYFNYDIKTEWSIDTLLSDKYTEINFIESYISPNHTIDYIKQNIYHYLDIVPEHQCLKASVILPTTELEGEHSPQKILLHNLFNNKINKTLEKQLDYLHFPIIDGVEELSYDEFISNELLLLHANEYLLSLIHI